MDRRRSQEHGEPGGHGRVLGLVHRPAHRPVRDAQGAGRRDGRDRGSGVHPLPVRQLAGRAVLAADPPVRRVHLARGRLAQASGAGWLDGGTALQGYWQHAVAIPAAGAGSPAITYDWYRTFLQTLLDNNAYTWFAWLITFGEMAVGVGLLVGCLTGVAAFFGAMMNMSFLLAGSASVNPVLFTLAIGLILAWKVAGYYGVDRYCCRCSAPRGTREPSRDEIQALLVPRPAELSRGLVPLECNLRPVGRVRGPRAHKSADVACPALVES